MLILLLSGLSIPITVSASFMGPMQAPPNGNVPGVVWNIPTGMGARGQQNATEFNIAGSGRLGGDLILEDSKALRIDKVGLATLNIGNWGSGAQPLVTYLYGDFAVAPVGPGGDELGDGGKILAQKFCLISDGCISNWPVGGGAVGDITGVTVGQGLIGGGQDGEISIDIDKNIINSVFVNQDGDTMTGALILNADPTGLLEATTKQYVDNADSGKISGISAGTGLTGGGTEGEVAIELTPAYIDGSAYDDRFVNLSGDNMTGSLIIDGFMDTKSGIRLYNNPAIETGVYVPFASMYGFYGFGNEAGGRFQNTLTNSGGSVGQKFYGGVFNGPSGGVGVGAEAFSANDYAFYAMIGKSRFNGDLELQTDIIANNNTPSACETADVGLGAGTVSCPLGKFLTGIRRNADDKIDGLVCCEL